MAITQQRMVDVINAGLDYKLAFETLIKEIDEAHELAQGGRITYQVALDTIMHIAGTGLLKKPASSRTALELEYKYFNSNWKRNVRSTMKQAKRREEAGIIPRKRKTPSLFIETSVLATQPEAIPLAQHIAQHGYSISPARQAEIEAEAERDIKQRKYLEARKAPVQLQEPPAIDLAHDPDDPENAFGVPGSSIISSDKD